MTGSASLAIGSAVPIGFAVTTYTHVGGTATSLAFGPDTRDLSKTRLYVAVNSSGQIVAFDDVAGTAGPAQVFASDFQGPLGVLVGADGTVFVADAEGPRAGPFGERTYGRVTRLRDTNGDGAADTREVVLRNLPNGRHNTNGMAFGPDGMLYVTNGNSTDDGVEGGDPEVPPWSGAVVRVDPAATDISLATLSPGKALVATGMRNIFDLAFSPFDPTHLFIPMNGADDARKNDAPPPDHLEDSDDLLYLTDVDDIQGKKKKARPVIDDFGFPSCLYNQQRRGNLEPYDNPNPDTIALFGRCPTASVPRPVWSFGLHVSADGLAFQRTPAWGPDFQNDLFVAEFGNFFGDEVVGHKVVRVQLSPGGTTVTSEEDFLSGGLPLDVTFDGAGNMFVADFSGAILKVTKLP
jgi:glucose/arabinose dehydrogenase